MYKVIIENKTFDVAKNTSIEDLIKANLPDISVWQLLLMIKKLISVL